MAKTSHFHPILSEIEQFLNAGRYEDAKVLLNFVDHDEADRLTQLRLLLINATIDGPSRYKGEIDQLATLSNPNDIEKEITSKILLLASHASEGDDRDYRPHSHPRNQSFDEAASRLPHANPSEEDTEHLRNYQSEVAALKEQLAELSASRDNAVRALQVTVNQQADLLQTKEAALDAQETRYNETIRTLEKQLKDKGELLKGYDVQLQAAREEVDRQTTQLSEFAGAKYQEVGLLRGKLNHQTELLHVKDRALKQLEEVYAEQVHAMRNQLGEQRSLMHRRNADLESYSVKLSELTRERDQLQSARETSERLAREELREKATLIQTMATAIEELEAQTSATIASLRQRLTEKQTTVERCEVELAELRNQMLFFTESLADVEDERHRARHAIPANQSERDNGTSTRIRIAKSIDIASIVFWDTIADGLSGLRRAGLGAWKPHMFSQPALAVVGSVLLIIPIAYLLGAQVRTTANTGANVGWKQSQERETSNRAELASKALRPPTTAGIGSQKNLKRDPRAATAATYVTRRSVTLRESPRYAGIVKTHIVSGSRVTVLASQGDWFKVKAHPTGAVGYVRKEYLLPHNYTQY